jgi:hypothetical protein
MHAGLPHAHAASADRPKRLYTSHEDTVQVHSSNSHVTNFFMIHPAPSTPRRTAEKRPPHGPREASATSPQSRPSTSCDLALVRARPNAGELGQVERSICQHAQGHECGQSAHRAHAAMQGAREGHTAIDMPMTLVWSCSNCSKKAKCSGTSIESDSHVVISVPVLTFTHRCMHEVRC